MLNSDTNTTYALSTHDGADATQEIIRLAGSDESSSDVILVASTGLSIARSSDRITFTNTVTNTDTQLTTEQVQDIVGAMLVGTETRIGVTYDDTNGRINFDVDDMTADTNTALTEFTLTADSGTNQTIAHGNTLDIAGGLSLIHI